jgi:hypothetical protein
VTGPLGISEGVSDAAKSNKPTLRQESDKKLRPRNVIRFPSLGSLPDNSSSIPLSDSCEGYL